jgi:ABC-2 type transport system permease protein
MRRLANILWLGVKELRSLAGDPVLALFMVYSFTLAVYSQATGISYELRNASVAILDEDRSQLSARLRDSLLPPQFKPPELITAEEVDRRMDMARNTFVLDIPPHFERELVAGRQPAIQLNVDATAMSQAGIGAGYLQRIVTQELAAFFNAADVTPVALRIRTAFNPNSESGWFVGVVALINNITMLTVLLAGAAVIREREHGTLDHLLAMPVTPLEIALSKLWANGLIITGAAGLSLWFVVHGAVGMPIAGSIPLFLLGVALYLFFATAVGLLLGTVARSMPQLGLLFMLVVLPMSLLSGGNSPFESMPFTLQVVMSAFPSTHFVAFAQAILYRGAGLDIVWPQFFVTGAIGALVMAAALLRFRIAIAKAVG